MASNSVVGFLSCLVSSVFFGSMFVPVKPFDAHDGFFVQWVMGCAIFIVGLVVNAFKHFPQFYPLSMLGGFLWATGNVTAIPIVNTIGMGLGILLWSFTNLLAGWASGRYGWFGLKPQVPKSDKLNYFGMLFALISTIMFVLVKPAEQHHSADEETATIDNINYEPDGVLASTEYPEVSSVNVNSGERRSILDRAATALKADPRRTLAILASLAAGTLYGLNFTPVIYIQDNYAGAPQDGKQGQNFSCAPLKFPLSTRRRHM